MLWVAYTTKNAGLQAKFKSFYTEWPQARQKIPYTQMQEMRIVPEHCRATTSWWRSCSSS